jgi:hypothetical protein
VTTQEVDETQCQFIIRLIPNEVARLDREALCRTVERLGGLKVTEGYAFPSAKHRAIALELLGDKYGSRYFEVR